MEHQVRRAMADLVSTGAETARRGTCKRTYERKYGEHMATTWGHLPDEVRSGALLLYRIDPVVAFAFGKAPVYSQTRYRFS